MDFETLPTPSLVLDVGRVKRNADRIGRRVRELGARLRPHIKTHKCIEVALIQISCLSNLRFAGILTHAGQSYHCGTREERLAVARHERDAMVEVAGRLRQSGIEVPTVSIGSTPTLTIVDHLDGIDEARPGSYIFFDAFMA